MYGTAVAKLPALQGPACKMTYEQIGPRGGRVIFQGRNTTVRAKGARNSRRPNRPRAIARLPSFVRDVNNSRPIKFELEWNPSESTHSIE